MNKEEVISVLSSFGLELGKYKGLKGEVMLKFDLNLNGDRLKSVIFRSDGGSYKKLRHGSKDISKFKTKLVVTRYVSKWLKRYDEVTLLEQKRLEALDTLRKDFSSKFPTLSKTVVNIGSVPKDVRGARLSGQAGNVDVTIDCKKDKGNCSLYLYRLDEDTANRILKLIPLLSGM